MKQHLSIEDIQELSFKTQEKLATLFGEYGNCFSYNGETCMVGKLSDRITLGRMLGKLDEDWFVALNPKEKDSYYEFQLEITERKDCKSADDFVDERTFVGDELVDVLYSAIKEVYLEV